MRPLLLGLCLALASLPAADARADVPPPDGRKYVGFAIRVEGASKFPGYALLAYPWSLSNGAPTWEAGELVDGEALDVGRRSPTPKLWAVPRARWAAFLQQKGARAAKEDLEAFFATAVACDAAVQQQHELPSSDPRTTVVQSFVVSAIDEKSCRLGAPGAPQPASSGSPAEPRPTPEPQPRSGGCAGCSVATEPQQAVATLALALALLARRGPRRRGGGPR